MPSGLYPRPSPATRFWNHVDKTNEYGCWTWTGYVDPRGYARISVENRPQFIHRFSYELHKGPIPEGLTIDHLCRTRHCVNPAHLEAVTDRENILRGISAVAVNARKTACPRGHPYSPRTLSSRGWKARSPRRWLRRSELRCSIQVGWLTALQRVCAASR